MLNTNHVANGSYDNILPFTPSQVENSSRFYRKQYKDYQLITRANDSGKQLHPNAKDLLVDYSGMINASEYDFIVIDPDSVEDITGRKKYQNNEYHKQLADIFIIKFHHSIKLPFNNRMRKYTNVYTIQFTTNGREILNNPAAFYDGARAQKHSTSNGKPGDLEWKTSRSYIEDNNNIIIKKDIDLDREAGKTNFSKVIEKDLGVSTRGCKTPEKIPKAETSTVCRQSVSDLSFNLNNLKSDEKTTMTTEAIPESGKLKDFYPLSAADHEKLKELSERKFSLDEMNIILLNLSEKSNEHSFNDKDHFLHYLKKRLKLEKQQEGNVKQYKLPEKKGEPVKREPIKGNQETAGKLTELVKAVFIEENETDQERCRDVLEALDISETKDLVKINVSPIMRSDWGAYGLINVYYEKIFMRSYWTLQKVCEQYNFTVELTCHTITEEKTTITPETKKKDEAFRQKCIERANEAEKQRQGLRHKTVDASLEFKPVSMSINKLLGLKSIN